MKPYEKYKDSGVEWIGKVPEHWEIIKLKYQTSKITDGTHVTPTYVENGIPFLRVTDIQTIEIDLNEVKRIPKHEHDELVKRCNPEKGDVLLSKNGTIGITKVVDWDWEFSIFVSLCLIKFKEKLFNKYFSIFFGSNVVDQQINEESKKTSVTNLHLEKIRELLICLPPLPEQTAIARYLDQKTREIDQLIAQKERLLALWEEEKTALINQAVTRGLDAGAKMKDSGVAWLGEVPEHWEVKRLKYVGVFRSGEGITSEMILPEGDFPVFGGNGIRGFYNKFTHDGTFILIGRQGALCGNIKYGNGKFWASEHAVVVHPLTEYDVVYLGELLRCMNLNQYSVAAAQPGLAVEMIKNLKIPFPKIDEQREVRKFIETQTARIQTQMDQTRKLLELLREYRATLISEVVTGKIKITE